MTGLPDHLDRAAGDPGADHELDLAALHQRAHARRTRRRVGLAGAAAVVLLAGAGLAWGTATSEPDRQVTASEGDPATTTTAGVEASTTTEPPATTSTTEVTATTGLTATTEAPVTTTTVPPTTTTVPTTTTPVAPSAGDVTLTGTYQGHETYRLNGPCEPKITDRLGATFTTDDGEQLAFDALYCGTMPTPTTWHGEGSGTFTAADGSTFSVAIDHDAPQPTTGVPYTMAITGGTGRYAGATGACDLTAELTNQVFGSQDHAGDFTCALDVGTVSFG